MTKKEELNKKRIKLCGRKANWDGLNSVPSRTILDKMRFENTNPYNPTKILVWEDFVELDLYSCFANDKVEKKIISKEDAIAFLKKYISKKSELGLMLEYTDVDIIYGPSPKFVIKRLLNWSKLDLNEVTVEPEKIKTEVLKNLPQNIRPERIFIEIV